MKGIRRLLFVACIIHLAACVPVCGRFPRLPGIDGVVTTAGTPVVGIRVALVSVNRNESCSNASAWVTSDDSGRFRIAPVMKNVEMVPLFPGDAFYLYQLCLQPRDGRVLSWRMRGHVNHVPLNVAVTCDLARSDQQLCEEGKELW